MPERGRGRAPRTAAAGRPLAAAQSVPVGHREAAEACMAAVPVGHVQHPLVGAFVESLPASGK